MIGSKLYKCMALVVMLIALYALCRIFLVDRFHIPTSSMMPTLQPGDEIVVNKTLMGARIYTDYHFRKEGIELQSFRTRGWRHIKHNDIVVFNRYNHHRKVRFVINDVYCKRCVALPGDTISIINGLYVNNNYMGTLGVVSEQKKLSVMPDSTVDKRCLRALPKDEHFDWTIRNFGPYYVPRKGDVMWMSPRTATMYKVLLEWELKTIVKIDWKRNLVMVGKKRLVWHRFRNDYYFMAGDNVLDSDDSRYKGPVPESYIVGIVSRIVDSKDVETQQRRWNRIGKAL